MLKIDDAITRLNPNGGVATIWREIGPIIEKQFNGREPNFWLSTYYGRPPEGAIEVVMVYDFIADVYPHLRGQTDIQWKWDAIERADVILTISPWVEFELRRLSAMRGIQRHGHIVPMGTSFTWRTAQAVKTVKDRYQLEGDYLLVTGRRSFYKNVRTLYQAMPMVEKKYQIVCVGGEPPSPYEMDFARRFDWRWLNHVPTRDVEALLAGASALVYPSLYEGFGLPVLDAFATRTPVICAPYTGMNFAEGMAVSIKPLAPKSIAEAINGLPDWANEHKEDITRAANLAQSASWEKTADAVLKVLEEAS